MRLSLASFFGLIALSLLGCSGFGSESLLVPAATPQAPEALPIAPFTSVQGSLGSAVQQGDLHLSALAIYTIDVDPVPLTATSRLKESRSGQANDDLYMLSIDRFLTADSFALVGITGTATTLDLDYLVTHPFAAPMDPTGTPNGSTNRADLGIGGMILFLADVPSAAGNTYFTDRVANTAIITNADAYYSPGGLLTVSGNANTFPCRQLVDELLDGTGSRKGISNDGDVTGNFGIDGWTRSEFGPSNDGWTGYGFLHQGQVTAGTLSLNRLALSSGFSLDLAIIAKYNDPRGGATPTEKKANRLPPATADATRFAYRGNHAALDNAQIAFAGQSGEFIANTITAATLSFHVVDWDARALETSAVDLSEDPAFNTVALGESGTATLAVCIPGLLGDATVTSDVSSVLDDDTAVGGDPGQDSGRPGDALCFSALVTKVAGSGQLAQDYTGMVRATDPETDLIIGLDGSLVPLGSPPEPITYQTFTATLQTDNAPPSATVVLTSPDPLLSGLFAYLSITSIADAENDNLDVLIDW